MEHTACNFEYLKDFLWIHFCRIKKNWNFTETKSCRFSQKLQKPQKLVLTKYWYCQNLISENISFLEIGSIILPCTRYTFIFIAFRASCFEFHLKKMYVQIANKKEKEQYKRTVWLFNIYYIYHIYLSVYLSIYLSISIYTQHTTLIQHVLLAVTIMTSWQLLHFGHMMYRFVCHVSQVQKLPWSHYGGRWEGICIKIIHILYSSCFAMISALWHTHRYRWIDR